MKRPCGKELTRIPMRRFWRNYCRFIVQLRKAGMLAMSKMLKIIGAVAVINIVARLFGFLREVVIANQYGATVSADAIVTAYTIPNFIYLVVGGALTTAFISVYHSSKSDKALY